MGWAERISACRRSGSGRSLEGIILSSLSLICVCTLWQSTRTAIRYFSPGTALSVSVIGCCKSSSVRATCERLEKTVIINRRILGVRNIVVIAPLWLRFDRERGQAIQYSLERIWGALSLLTLAGSNDHQQQWSKQNK